MANFGPCFRIHKMFQKVKEHNFFVLVHCATCAVCATPCVSTSGRSRLAETVGAHARSQSAGAVRSSIRACSSGAISSSWRGSVCSRSRSRCCLWFSRSCRSHSTCRCAAESVYGRRSIKTCSLPENTRSASSQTRKPTWRWRHATHLPD